MEWNPTISLTMIPRNPVTDPRRRAETALAEAADRPNYGMAVLCLVAELSVDEQIHQSVAVNFKNHLKAHWAQQPNDPARNVLPDVERGQIKALIITLMVNTSPKIQAQLIEALTIIGNFSFSGYVPKQDVGANEPAYLKFSHYVNENLLPNGVEVTPHLVYLCFRLFSVCLNRTQANNASPLYYTFDLSKEFQK